MIYSSLLYVLTFALFLTVPGAVTGAIFLASTIGYFAISIWHTWRVN